MFIRTVEHPMADMWEEGVPARYLLNRGLEARPRTVRLHAPTKDRIRTRGQRPATTRRFPGSGHKPGYAWGPARPAGRIKHLRIG